MGFLAGKRALIIGLASDRSIAYGIAEAMRREGAELAFNYQNEKLQGRVEDFAKEFGSSIAYQMDVASDDSITEFFGKLKSHWDSFDVLVHSVAYAPNGQLEGDYLDCVNRDGFRIAHDISSYSFAAVAKVARDMMRPNGSMVTMTYLGAERALPNYNVMGVAKASLEANVRYMAASLGPRGIRVNAVSAGPIRTLAASGVKNFRKMLSYYEKVCPLRRNVTIEDVGNVTAFLCSDLSAAVTGEVVHVDNGYHFISMPELESAE